MRDDLYEWWWKYGGRIEFLIRENVEIDKMIKEGQAKLIPRENFAYLKASPAGPAVREKAASTNELLWISPRGGIRVPHLHYNGDIYSIEAKAWQAFSSKILDRFKEKLQGVKSVNFEQVMALANAMDTLE